MPMSTIVAVEKAGRIAVAWDELSTIGSTRCVNKLGPPKVQRVGSSIVGSAGLSTYRNVLDHYLASKKPPVLKDERAIFQFFVRFWRDMRARYHFVNDQADTDDPSPFADMAAEFLVANRHGLFLVKEILSVTRLGKFCAIGSGAPHAEGALQVLYDQDGSAKDIAQTAVQVALEFDAASVGPVQVLELQERTKPARKNKAKRTNAGTGR